jgi:hypothetical protein
LPVVDNLAVEYGDRVAFVAPAWKASLADTARRAAELLPSGIVQWGLDADEAVFAAFGVPFQPVTVLIGADKTVVEQWVGVRSEAETRAAIERLIAGE